MSVNLPIQKVFNQILAEKVASALSGKLDGKFVAVTYPAGFNYGITYGTSAFYNEQTLSTMDSTIQTDEDGIVSISDQRLSSLLDLVLNNTPYVFSKATEKQLNEWDEATEAQIAAVLSAFTDCGFKFTDPVPPGGKLGDVLTQLAKAYGELKEDYSNLPIYLAPLKSALLTYDGKAHQALMLRKRYAEAQLVPEDAIANITKPTKDNGALQTEDTSYYVAFDKLPTANQLIGSLGTSENRLAIHLSGDSFSSNDCKVHMEGKGIVSVPILGLFGITSSGSAQVDIGEYTSERTSFSIDITYPGLTTVGVIPKAQSLDRKQGWYPLNLLKEVQEKTGNDNVDGYKLAGTEFSVETLFGPKGRLNYLKTLVISQEPSIDITFREINIDEFRKHVHTDDSVTVKLFGFITLGSVKHSYTMDQINFNENEKSVTLHLGAPNVSGTIPLSQQVAHLLGGVPAYT